MRLLVDTDAFCKLSACGLFQDAVNQLDLNISDCGRLPALPHMLRKGKLRKKYGDSISDFLIPIAENIPLALKPMDFWSDKLTLVPDIDPGEALIFAKAAESNILVLTDDKRALRALKNVPDFPLPLSGNIIVLEAILLALCNHFGFEYVRQRIQPLINIDRMTLSCFSPGNPNPPACLLSYLQSLSTELSPLVLWNPQ